MTSAAVTTTKTNTTATPLASSRWQWLRRVASAVAVRRVSMLSRLARRFAPWPSTVASANVVAATMTNSAAPQRTRRARAALLRLCRDEMKMTLVVRRDLRMGTGKIAAQCAHAATALVERLHELQQQQQERAYDNNSNDYSDDSNNSSSSTATTTPRHDDATTTTTMAAAPRDDTSTSSLSSSSRCSTDDDDDSETTSDGSGDAVAQARADRRAAHTPRTWLRWYATWRHDGCAKVVLQCADEAELLQLAQRAKTAALPCYVIRDAGRTQIASGSRTVLGVGPAPKHLVDAVTGQLKLL